MKLQRGQTIIELLLAMGFALIFFPALFTMFFVSREGKAQQIERTRATTLLVEAQEALRSIRETGWSQFALYANNTVYHPAVVNARWTLANGTETIDRFTRVIEFSPVQRDISGNIVSSGGITDPSTRRATIRVSWTTPLPTSISSVVILTRHNNIIHVDTTEQNFLNGDATQHTRVINLAGGEVVLGSTGGYGDWCQPSLTITAVDLPKSGVANAISAIQGAIAAGTGDNASGVSYANVLITDPEFPTNPIATTSGTFDGYKTNDVFTEAEYAYLATDTNTKEVEIIALGAVDGSGKFAEAGYFNAPGNGNAEGVVTAGSVGYMVGGTKMYSFDLSSKTGSRSVLDADGITLPGTGKSIVVSGGRAFVATSATNAQVVIVDVSNPSDLRIVDQIGLSASGGKAIYINASGTRAYVATEQSSAQREFFIVNTESGAAGYKQVLGSYDTGSMNPKGLVVVSGPRAIIVGLGGEEYQVVDITSETANPLPRCGGIEINSGVNGIDTVLASSGRAYSYIITGDASSELKIIEGGPGANGRDYFLTGVFESQIFDATLIATGSSEVAFNRIEASISVPSAQSSVTLQFAAADAVGGSCAGASYIYVGPDGTAGTSYVSSDGVSISGALPFSGDGTGYENPARCFRYRAQLTTGDATLTPILNDVSIALSP
ncbi:hypothetical protein HZB58_01210 [Candidatus Gottesmanbacteria bacterium]|nr:hypothetical protein [Candidatus Gottesmanbacteria bacterium]